MHNLNRKINWVEERYEPIRPQSRNRSGFDRLRQPAPPPSRRPLFLQPYPEEERFPERKRVEERPMPQPRVRRAPRRQPSVSKRTQQRSWGSEELTFSMNKRSLTGMVFGLMLLGTLFFIGGFLTAFSFYGFEARRQQVYIAASMPAQPQSWTTANNMPNNVVTNVGAYQARNQVNQVQDATMGAAASRLTSHVPGFAQPMAQQAVGNPQRQVNRQVNQAFYPNAPQPQQVVQQQPVVQVAPLPPQAYPVQPTQPYYPPQPQIQQQPQMQPQPWQQQNMVQPTYYPPQY